MDVNILKNLINNQYVITVSYDNYFRGSGGTDKLLQAHHEIFVAHKLGHVHLFPLCRPIRLHNVFGMLIEDKFAGWYTSGEIIEVLVNGVRCSKYPVAFYIHHLINNDLESLSRILDVFNLPVNVYIHDYYMICNSYNLLKYDGEYCGLGNVSPEKCSQCSFYSVARKRSKNIRDFLDLYNKRIKFIAPSKTAKDVFAKAYPEYTHMIEIVPHQILKSSYHCEHDFSNDRPLRLAYVGKQANEKGWLVWERITKEINKCKLPYELYHFGTISDHYDYIREIPVSFNKAGHNAMIEALRKYKIDLVFLWSEWPETYSFTYFESYAADAFIITNNGSGNISQVVKENKNGIVFHDTDKLIEFILNTNRIHETLNVFWRNTHKSPEHFLNNDAFLSFSFNKELYDVKYPKHHHLFISRFSLFILKVLYLIKIKLKVGV